VIRTELLAGLAFGALFTAIIFAMAVL